MRTLRVKVKPNARASEITEQMDGIDPEGAESCTGERATQVERGRGLTHATFLAEHGDLVGEFQQR